MDTSRRSLSMTLGGLFFLTYFAPGAIFTAVFTFLARPLATGGLGLSARQVAVVAAAGALGSLAAMGLVHKLRGFSCRRVLVILFTVGAVLLGLLAEFASEYATSAAPNSIQGRISAGAPGDVVAVVAILLGCFTATNSAAAASGATFIQQSIGGTGLSFFQLRSAGTWGWICGAASLLMVTPVSIQPFWLGCAALLIAALYTLMALRFLREVPIATSELDVRSSWRTGQRKFPAKELALLLILVGVTAILGRMYDIYGNQFLTEIKFPRPCATQPLLAQFPEFLLLLLVPFAALSPRYCLVLGPLGWVCVFFGFFVSYHYGNHLAVYLTLPFQAGNCIMQTTASIAIDSMFRSSHFRRTAQATLPFVQGTGLLLGSLVNGVVVSCTTNSAGITSWNQVWLVASIAAVVATVLASAMLIAFPLGRFEICDSGEDKRRTHEAGFGAAAILEGGFAGIRIHTQPSLTGNGDDRRAATTRIAQGKSAGVAP